MADPWWYLWWVWMAGALVLAILEVLAPGYVFLGFSIGAASVALLLALFAPPVGLPMLLLVFAALSLVAWLLLRRLFPRSSGQVKIIERDINED